MEYGTPRGTSFVRIAIAMGLSFDPKAWVATARHRWGPGSEEVRMLEKAAVSGGEMGELTTAAQVDFLDAVGFSAVADKETGFRRVPAGTPVFVNGSAAVGYWVGESKAIPLSPVSLTKTSLRPLKVAGLCVVTKELVMAGGRDAEETIRKDIVSATARLSNWAMFATGNGGSTTSPASITHSAIVIASTGVLEDDLAAAVAAHQGDFASSFWVMTPQLATRIGLRIGSRGIGELGPNGGALLGLRVHCVDLSDSDGDSFSLVDAARVLLTNDGVSVAMATDAMIEFSDTPSGASDVPVASSQTLVSLFDTESVAFRIVRRTNWLAAPGAVVVVTGVNYVAS